MRALDLPPHALTERPRSGLQVMLHAIHSHQREVSSQRPNASPEPLSARFWRPEISRNSGQTSPSPAASTGRRSGQFGTLLGATGGTQTHSRRTGGKLGQLRCARQGLVRVPKSNTKYGGKTGKTGGRPAPLMAPSISESSGIPKRKKLYRARRRLRPAVHRATIYCRPRGCIERDSGEATGCPGWHARRPIAASSDNRQGAANSTGPFTP